MILSYLYNCAGLVSPYKSVARIKNTCDIYSETVQVSNAVRYDYTKIDV